MGYVSFNEKLKELQEERERVMKTPVLDR